MIFRWVTSHPSSADIKRTKMKGSAQISEESIWWGPCFRTVWRSQAPGRTSGVLTDEQCHFVLRCRRVTAKADLKTLEQKCRSATHFAARSEPPFTPWKDALIRCLSASVPGSAPSFLSVSAFLSYGNYTRITDTRDCGRAWSFHKCLHVSPCSDYI